MQVKIMQRRQFMKGGLAAITLAGGGSTGLFLLNKNGLISTAEAAEFLTPLPIPPLLENLDKTGLTAQF
jgi:hypothetical protein